MKKIYLFFAALLIGTAANSQCSVVVNSSTNVSCFGQCDGSVSLTTLGVPPYTYSWSSGQTVQNPSDFCAGSYTVTMTDANACQSTASVTITQPTDIVLSATATNVTCNGACNGHAQVTATGGTAPYSYSWNDPQSSTTDTASSLCPGTYTCTVTDFHGCSKFTSITITQPAALSAAMSATSAMCHDSCDATIAASVTGGTPPYSYQWSTGCTTSGCNNVCAGSYTVIITDANACSKIDSITVTQPTALMDNTSETDATCSTCSDGSASAAPTGGTAPYTYMWSPGGQTTASVTGLSPGIYTVCVTDNNGCENCDTVTVSSPSGIKDESALSGISVYPNPAGAFINVSSVNSGKIKLTLYDITGRMILSEEYAAAAGSTKTIGLAGQNPGVYFIRIEMNKQKSVQKIIKY